MQYLVAILRVPLSVLSRKCYQMLFEVPGDIACFVWSRRIANIVLAMVITPMAKGFSH